MVYKNRYVSQRVFELGVEEQSRGRAPHGSSKDMFLVVAD
jgi:hypothetical protein